MAVRGPAKKDTNMYDVREFYRIMPPLTVGKYWFDVMKSSPHKVQIFNDVCRVTR